MPWEVPSPGVIPPRGLMYAPDGRRASIALNKGVIPCNEVMHALGVPSPGVIPHRLDVCIVFLYLLESVI